MPASATLSASGKAHSCSVSGPVNAEVHHWLVGSARSAISRPACTGVLPGRAPTGKLAAMLPFAGRAGRDDRGARVALGDPLLVAHRGRVLAGAGRAADRDQAHDERGHRKGARASSSFIHAHTSI